MSVKNISPSLTPLGDSEKMHTTRYIKMSKFVLLKLKQYEEIFCIDCVVNLIAKSQRR